MILVWCRHHRGAVEKCLALILCTRLVVFIFMQSQYVNIKSVNLWHRFTQLFMLLRVYGGRGESSAAKLGAAYKLCAKLLLPFHHMPLTPSNIFFPLLASSVRPLRKNWHFPGDDAFLVCSLCLHSRLYPIYQPPLFPPGVTVRHTRVLTADISNFISRINTSEPQPGWCKSDIGCPFCRCDLHPHHSSGKSVQNSVLIDFLSRANVRDNYR